MRSIVFWVLWASVAACACACKAPTPTTVNVVKSTLEFARGELVFAMEANPDDAVLVAVDQLLDAINEVADRALETGKVTGRDAVEALLKRAETTAAAWIAARADLTEAERAHRQHRVKSVASLIRALPWEG